MEIAIRCPYRDRKDEVYEELARASIEDQCRENCPFRQLGEWCGAGEDKGIDIIENLVRVAEALQKLTQETRCVAVTHGYTQRPDRTWQCEKRLGHPGGHTVAGLPPWA